MNPSNFLKSVWAFAKTAIATIVIVVFSLTVGMGAHPRVADEIRHGYGMNPTLRYEGEPEQNLEDLPADHRRRLNLPENDFTWSNIDCLPVDDNPTRSNLTGLPANFRIRGIDSLPPIDRMPTEANWISLCANEPIIPSLESLHTNGRIHLNLEIKPTNDSTRPNLEDLLANDSSMSAISAQNADEGEDKTKLEDDPSTS